MQPITTWVENINLGIRKDDNASITLYAPTWDCNWYWGFGYLGNRNEHYHLHDYQNNRNINMRDALHEDYQLNPRIEKELWVFCELCLTAYSLRETAEIYHRGGSRMTSNPCSDIIENDAEYRRINWVVLPAIFDKINEIFIAE